MAGVGVVERESLRLDQLLDCCTQPLGSLAREKAWSRRLWESLPDVWLASKTVAMLKPRTTGVLVSVSPALGLSPRRKRPHNALGIVCKPACRSHGSQDGIIVLSTFDAAPPEGKSPG